MSSNSTSGYLRPVQALAELVQDETPSFVISPRSEYVLLYDVPSYLSLVDVAREEVRVAGLRFNGQLRSASRVRWSSWARIRSIKRILDTGVVDATQDVVLKVPPKTKLRMFEFSKDNKYLAFLMDGGDNTELWVAEVKTGDAKRLATHLNSVLMKPFHWRRNVLLVARIPEANRSDGPKPTPIPTGPMIKEHEGGKAAPARTYHDLLSSDHDELVFEHFAKSELTICNADTGAMTKIPQDSGLFSSVEISPDCEHLLIHSIVRPYSRVLPASRFSKNIFVIQLGSSIDQLSPASQMEVLPFTMVPCQEDLSTSFDARTRGPRSIEFAWNEPHTLVYVQSLDGGEPDKQPDTNGHRDALFFVYGPQYDDVTTHQKVFSGPLRIESAVWSEQGTMIIEESWYKTRQENSYAVDLERAAEKNKITGSKCNLMYSRSSDDVYASWGSPRIEFDQNTGYWRVKRRPTDAAIMYISEGASPNGSRPFLDFRNVLTDSRERLWRSPAVPSPQTKEDPQLEPLGLPVDESSRKGVFERPIDVIWANTAPLYSKVTRLLITSESPTSPPNLMLVELQGGLRVNITSFPHPQPSLLGVKKELIRYTRGDGVELSANLYLPANYDGKTKLPLLCWAYPLEFKSKEHAGQIKTSPYRFIRTSWSSPTLWLSRQFAVLDNFSVPIVGVGDAEPNDTFVEQLVGSAEAAVKECVKRGVADENRVAVGGVSGYLIGEETQSKTNYVSDDQHSYGAFMSVHLLAHTRLFKGAIGRSGACRSFHFGSSKSIRYTNPIVEPKDNRLLTPFSYQAEERTFWQAPETYLKNSPFTHVDKIEAPLLLIHGSDDPNPGTHVFQTERLFAAMQGLGKKVRMVILPCERHSYDALESVLHVVAEQDLFLQKYVAGSPANSTADAEQAKEEERVKRAKI